MKTLRIFLTLVIFFGLGWTADVNAQKKSEKLVFEGTFYCLCAGENLHFKIVVHEVINENLAHYNVMSGTLEGLDSGETYRFISSENYKSDGETRWNLRFINKGIVRFEHVILTENKEVYWVGCGW